MFSVLFLCILFSSQSFFEILMIVPWSAIIISGILLSPKVFKIPKTSMLLTFLRARVMLMGIILFESTKNSRFHVPGLFIDDHFWVVKATLNLPVCQKIRSSFSINPQNSGVRKVLTSCLAHSYALHHWLLGDIVYRQKNGCMHFSDYSSIESSTSLLLIFHTFAHLCISMKMKYAFIRCKGNIYFFSSVFAMYIQYMLWSRWNSMGSHRALPIGALARK